MPKILAIDYGKKRCGIAATDELQIIASGLTTVQTKELNGFIDTYIKENKIETIVIGEPRRMDGSASHVTEDVHALAKKLSKTYPSIEIALEDERYTSKMAKQALIDSGVKKKDRRKKELIDEVSATIILQSYLQGR